MNNKIRYRVLQAIIIFIQSVHYFFHRTQFHIDGMKCSILFSTNNIHISRTTRLLRAERNSTLAHESSRQSSALSLDSG